MTEALWAIFHSVAVMAIIMGGTNLLLCVFYPEKEEE
jgi:hypothetical protein